VDIQNLLTKFFAGEISEDEAVQLKSWLNEDHENRLLFDRQNELWQSSGTDIKCRYYNPDTAWANILSRPELELQRRQSVKVVNTRDFRIFIAAATVCGFLIAGAVSLWLNERITNKHMRETSSFITTNEGEKASVYLSDSTEVIMNSQSSLQYYGNYNLNDRRVRLSGEAYFDVRTNREKPFIVQLKNMNLIATGTKFNVYSFENEDRIETTLEQGEVKVEVNGKKPVLLKTGQQAVYFVNSQCLLVRDVSTDTYTSWKENMLKFNDTPLEEVLRRIGRKYNVVFEISNKELLDLKYTATFIDESLDEVMEMLKSVTPINYRIYYRTSVKDKKYLKPKIVVYKRKYSK
jgi:transmembrane sensor